MALSEDQALKIMAGGALMQFAHAELSDFELELVSEVSLRWLRHGCEAVVTDLEWPALDEAIEAMRAGVRAGRVAIPVAYRIAA